MYPSIRLLAISGSLRVASVNTAMLRAASLVAPERVKVSFYERLGELPYFDPELDDDMLSPAIVADFRARIFGSHAVLLSTPEYGHGIPGVLKNALDWVSRSGELVGKAVGIISPAGKALRAHAQLSETLTVMAARIVPEACTTMPMNGRSHDAAAIAASAECASILRRLLGDLAAVVDADRSVGPER